MMSESARRKFCLFIEFRGGERKRKEQGAVLARECDHCIANLFICT